MPAGGLPKAAPCNVGSSGRPTDTHLVGGLAAKRVPGFGPVPHLTSWRAACPIRPAESGHTTNPRRASAAARRGRSATEESTKDPEPAPTAPGDDDPTSGGSAKQQQQPSRRRQFGPEPAPQLATGATDVAEAPAAGPKRRGRPPKQKAEAAAAAAAAADLQPTLSTPPTPIEVNSYVLTSSAAAAELAKTLAAATSASSSATTAPTTDTTSNSSGTSRRPFGPEPPAPPPPPKPTSPDAVFASALPFSLPADPGKLDLDDILDLPLPDPRVGERFRLDGDLSDLGEQLQGLAGDDAAELAAAANGAIDDDDAGADDDSDLDYDQLISLANRIDAASYVARAFERAKEGLDPDPDPSLSEVDVKGAAAAAPPPPSPAPQPAASAAQGAAGSRRAAAAASTYPSSTSSPFVSSSSDAPSAAGAPPASRQSPTPNAVYVDDDFEDDEPEDVDDGEGGGGAEGGERLSAEEEAAARRRVELLVELLSASGAELEAKLEAAAPEVDEPLLALLERRYRTALALRQDAASAERIATLYRALRYVYERRSSSAAERLLDDVLSILGDTSLQADPDRRRGEAAARLRNAFTGGMLDVDVFTAAEALAEGRQAAAEALAGEMVSLEAFKAEAMGLLSHAKRVQQDTAASLVTIEGEVARLRAEEGPGVLEGVEWRLRLEQVRLARQALGEREEAIAALEEVLVLMRAVELQMLTGRMAE